ncbi:MAG: NUDIX hydrolase [Cyanobacteriota bacterium]|nr:NUDIX hydrolase [Cyanobacteriota bacterium]
MSKKNKIRVLALGLIRDGDRLFISQGYDSVKQEFFYRVMGGGVNFGEYSRDALQREFQEEIQAELTNIKYLGCMENIFLFNGEERHELIQLYKCDFADKKFYQTKELTFWEKERKKTALWVSIDRLKSGELKIVPENFLEYCD